MGCFDVFVPECLLSEYSILLVELIPEPSARTVGLKDFIEPVV